MLGVCAMRNYLWMLLCVLCCVSGTWAAAGATDVALADATRAPASVPSTRVSSAVGAHAQGHQGTAHVNGPVRAPSAVLQRAVSARMPSPLSGSLVVAGSLAEPELEQAQAQTLRLTPAAVRAREVSQTAYEHLDAPRARALARRLFPRLIDESAGGLPQLPAGATITKIPADNIAQVTLSGGKHAVLESFAPIALETARGRHTLIDLHLHEANGAFAPILSPVGLRIPKRLGEGVDLGRTGVSLTPVAAGGAALAGSGGEVQGATVSYANTQTDADTLVKPTTSGFSMETLLRAADSPRELHYRVGLPLGAWLRVAPGGSPVDVLQGSERIATVLAPTAHDAEGIPVPVTMSVSGDTLSVTVASLAGYTLPVVVDPTAEDTIWQNESIYRTEWYFEHYGAGFGSEKEHPEGGSWTENIYSGHNPGEWGGLFYSTRGASKIVQAHVEGHWNDSGSHIQNYVILLDTSKGHNPEMSYTEDYDDLPEATESYGFGGYACAPERKCPETVEGEAKMVNENTAGYLQYATGSGEGHGGENTVTKASVVVSQEQGPELEFNKASETIYNKATGEYVPNVLDAGHESWLGPHRGSFEVRAKDPGIGLSYYRVLTTGWGDYKEYFASGECHGIQCPEYNYQGYTYKNGMPDGETSFEALAQDYVGLSTQVYPQKIKIDATPPHNLKIVGLRNGNELPIGETHLKVEATDGEGPTKSSGVQSIMVKVEGREIAGTSASCPEGPCTASTEVTLASRDYTPGTHSLVVTATDNAGNVVEEEFTFRVRGTSPVSVGPGSVEPSSGQFALSATDASLGGASKVARTYRSRNLTAGEGGPFGPQWATNLGAGEGLTVQPGGSVVINSSDGGLTTFALNAKGELEAPKGDSNLKLEYKATGHQYVLTDSKAGSETIYEQPSSIQSTSPTFGEAFGWEPGELKRPVSDALDASGDLWVTDWTGDRLAKFSPSGALFAEYGSEGSGAGQFSSPWGVAINQKTGNVYVTDYGNNRIEELSSSGAFVKAIGWGVTNGKAEYQICTTKCQAGIAGSGKGQFYGPLGVSIDSSGDIWVVDLANERVEEFNEGATYLRQFGSSGSGAGQLSSPMNVAFAGGNAYVTDESNNRLDEFSMTGSFVQAIGWGVSNGKAELETCTSSCKAGVAGLGNGQFDAPRGLTTDPVSGNLYVSEISGDRVQEITPAGAFVTKFGSGGSESGQFAQAMGVAVSPVGSIYVTDFENARVQEWSRPMWWPTSTKGASVTAATYTYAPVEDSAGTTSMQPYEVLAPTPAGVSCGTKAEELKEEKDKGCRALTFKYASATTATGENESEWGEYKGRLVQVVAHVYNPSEPPAKAMEEKAVAQYSYDKQGRLRAEWDPRLEHPLKTLYGYDAEGQVTSLTPPGEESWAFTYGTFAGDTNAGRLLKVYRASASTSLWSGETVKNTETPKLSGSATVGVRMGVSNGVWTNALVYGYQWEDCTKVSVVIGGKLKTVYECSPIAGATNANYEVQSSDEGFYITASVIATNGGGSTLVRVEPPVEVKATGEHSEAELHAPQPGTTIEYGVPLSGSESSYLANLTQSAVEKWAQKKDDPVEGTAVFPPDEPQGWPASGYKRATINYWDTSGRTVNTVTPTGGVSTTEYNEANEVVRALSADNRAAALKEGCKLLPKECKSAEVAERLDSKSKYNGETTAEKELEEKEGKLEYGARLLETRGPEHKVKLASGTEVEARAVTHDYYDEGAKEAESKNKETYSLLTKTVTAALLSNGEEKEKRETVISYNGEEDLGWKLRKPTSVTKEPNGLDLTTSTVYSKETGDVLETTSPIGNKTNPPPAYDLEFGSGGSGNGQFNDPTDTAIDSSGDVWVTDVYNNRVEKFSSSGAFIAAYGKTGSKGEKEKEEPELNEPLGIAISAKTGNVYIGDQNNDRVVELSGSTGKVIRVFGKGSSEGELKEPAGVAIDSKGNVWVVAFATDKVEEFNEEGKYIKSFGAKGTACGDFNGPGFIAASGEALYVTDGNNSRVEKFTEEGKICTSFGSAGSGNGQFKEPIGIAAASNGNVYVVDRGNTRVQEFSSAGTFLTSFGTKGTGNGQFEAPEGVVINSAGDIYVTDAGSNNRVQKWVPNSPASHTSRTIYYTVAANEHKNCGEHVEWANLVCQIEPVEQPADLPSLPVSTFTYNIWDGVEKTEEKFTRRNAEGKEETVTRTKAQTYDPAGRALTSKETVSPATDTALPEVTNKYNTETGELETQTATIGGKEKTITSKYNRLGQLVEYADAEGNVAKYVYEEGSDGRLEELSEGKGKEAGSYQTYSYNSTTGLMEKLVDSAAGTFTASYDVEGRMTGEVYPNGMCANTTYNPSGTATHIEYLKPKTCTEGKTVWFSDSIAPAIYGETLEQTSTLAKEKYSYDNAGRLLEAQETPAGKDCVSRLYSYDEEGNRTSQTTRESSSETCATEGGQFQAHIYDTANRLVDSGVEYEVFGNTTRLPAADAGEHEIVSTYYIDNQIATEKQNEQLLSYTYDPAGRTMEVSSENEKTKAKTATVRHYAGAGEALTWTSEGAEKWTRNIAGIDGALDAIQVAGSTPILQLHDLQGNIVGTVGDSESETKLATTYNSTEFGVPQAGATPPKYAWLGAADVSSEPAQGAGTSTESGSSYVPEIGRPLQTGPIASPGAFPDGTGGTGIVKAANLGAAVQAFSGTAMQNASEREEAKRREAEEKASLEVCPVTECGEVGPGEGNAEDPIDHYRAWEAKEKAAGAEKILAGADAVEGIASLFGSFGDLLSGTIEAMVTTEIASGWLSEYAELLNGCVAKLHNMQDAHGGCRLQYSAIVGNVPDFFAKPIISVCYTGKSASTAVDGLALSNCERLIREGEGGIPEA
jgi:DNA-binding beta-propeller fold protein YncE